MAENRVFVAETKEKSTEIVRAIDRETGRELWKAEWPGAMSVPFMAKRNGDWIRSTPACDGQSLFVAGMRDVLVCLDAKTGKERWRIDFVEQFNAPLPDFGFVCSPLVVGDFVYVQAGAGFCKLDKIFTSSYGGGSRLLEIKRAGDEFQVQTVWKTPLQGYMSTPVIIDGHAYLHLRSQKFTCVELKTGKQT